MSEVNFLFLFVWNCPCVCFVAVIWHLGRKGFISSFIDEGSHGRSSRQEPWGRNWCREQRQWRTLLPGLSRLRFTYASYTTQDHLPGWHCPRYSGTVGPPSGSCWENSLQTLATAQPDGGSSSVEDPSSRILWFMSSWLKTSTGINWSHPLSEIDPI